MDHVRATIAAIAPHDSEERFTGLGVRVIRDWARFTSPTEVATGAHRIRARRFVLATGSSPMVPPIPGLDTVPYLTNETIFEQRDCPRHLLIVGGGPIGLELAQAHRRLGAAVTVIEAATRAGARGPRGRRAGPRRAARRGGRDRRGRRGRARRRTARRDRVAGQGRHGLSRHASADRGGPGAEHRPAGPASRGDREHGRGRHRRCPPAHVEPPRPCHRRCRGAGAVHASGGLSRGRGHPLDPLRPAGEGARRSHPARDLYRPRTRPDRPDRGRGASGAWRGAAVIRLGMEANDRALAEGHRRDSSS
jgi:hypothetical protein